MRRGRGAGRPIVVQQRRGPGLLGTVAQTAVIAGTATVVSNKVSGSMNASAQQAALAEQQQAAAQQALLQQQIDEAAQRAVAAQQVAPEPPQPPPTPAAPAPAAPDRITQLQKLAELKQLGILSDAEFEAEKARILAS